MPHTFADALRELDVTLGDVHSTLRFVKAAAYLRPRLGNMGAWDNLDADSMKAVQAYVSEKTFQPDTTFRGLYIVLYGALEQFTRRLIRDAVVVLDAAVGDFDDLDDRIKFQNAYRTGQALATIGDPPDHMVIDYEELCRRIGTCTTGSLSFGLNAEAFSLFYTNLTPARLEDVLKRLGIKTNWDIFGGDPALKQLVGCTGTRDAATAVKQRLSDFTKTRNRLAHNGSVGVTITDVDVEEMMGFLKCFARALADMVDKGLPRRRK